MIKNIVSQEYNQLLSDLKCRVASCRYKAALSVNKDLAIMVKNPSNGKEGALATQV